MKRSLSLILAPFFLLTVFAVASFASTEGSAGGWLGGAGLFLIALTLAGGYFALLTLFPAGNRTGHPAVEQTETKGMARVILIGLLICAFALRFYKLETGIWYDEMLAYLRHAQHSVWQIVTTFEDASNHVLYSVLARLSLTAFGDGIWALRFPAAIFGVASIWAVYSFGRRVTTVNESLFAAALLTFSFHHIWFSQNARGYTAVLFFTLLSSAWLLDAMREGSPRKWLLYAVAVFLGAYTHLTIAFMIVGQFLVYAGHLLSGHNFRKRMEWNGLLYGFIPAALLTLLGYASILSDMLSGALLNSGLQGPQSEWTNPIWALMEIVNALKVGFSGGVTGLGAAIGATLIVGLGLWGYLRTSPSVVALLLIPTVLGFVFMTSIGYTLFPRFFFFALGFGALVLMKGATLLSSGAARLAGLDARWQNRASILLCVVIVAVSAISLRYVHLPKQDYEGALAHIEENLAAGDKVFTVGIAGFPFNEYYGKEWPRVTSAEELDQMRGDARRLWLVYTMPVHAQTTYSDILERIDRDFDVVGEFYGTLNGGGIIVARERD